MYEVSETQSGKIALQVAGNNNVGVLITQFVELNLVNDPRESRTAVDWKQLSDQLHLKRGTATALIMKYIMSIRMHYVFSANVWSIN